MANRAKSKKKEAPPIFAVGDLARCYDRAGKEFIEGEITEVKTDEINPDEVNDEELEELVGDSTEPDEKKKRRRPMVRIFDTACAWFFWVPAARCVRVTCQEETTMANTKQQVECAACRWCGDSPVKKRLVRPGYDYPLWCRACGAVGLRPLAEPDAGRALSLAQRAATAEAVAR